eukprot:gene10862-12073_t
MDLEEGVPIPATSSDAGNTVNSHSGIKAVGPHHHHHNPEEHHEYDPQLKVAFVPPIEGTPAALALAANAAIKVSKLEKGLHKFRTMKRPKMKSLNLVKKLNKTTKTKRSQKHFSTNFKGKVIDGVHELYTLTAGMMLGIRYSIDQVLHSDSPNTAVLSDDFNFFETVAFPPKGCTTGPHITPAHSLAHTFEFKTYCPKVFKRVREFFDIDAPSYIDSVCGDYNYLEFISNSKSGQFFFYSHDGKYMLKTQTKEENKFMRRILPNYYKYMMENPHSLLVRILGMHRIEMYHLRRKVHFVVMTSVFDSPVKINSIYDLKGSLLGREATPKERESGGVLKDMDLINDRRKIHLGSKRAAVLAQLSKDAAFLAHNHIMDYSLLIGIHDRNTREPTVEPSVDLAPKSSNPVIMIHRQHSNTPFRRNSNAGQTLSLAALARLSSTSSPPRPDRLAVGHDLKAGDDYSANSDSQITSNRLDYNDDVDRTPFKLSLPYEKEQKNHDGENGVATRSVEDNESVQATFYTPSKEVDANLHRGEEEEGESDCEDDSDYSDEDDIDEGDSEDEVNGRTHTDSIQSRPPTVRFSAMTNSEGHVYGNGMSLIKPWTGRLDGGINSRIGKNKGNEIYFMGIIDILQEYNTSKRMETVFKGLTHDVRQISSVDPFRYAERFVKFMEANFD